jgi:hypothetical protein
MYISSHIASCDLFLPIFAPGGLRFDPPSIFRVIPGYSGVRRFPLRLATQLVATNRTRTTYNLFQSHLNRKKSTKKVHIWRLKRPRRADLPVSTISLPLFASLPMPGDSTFPIGVCGRPGLPRNLLSRLHEDGYREE